MTVSSIRTKKQAILDTALQLFVCQGFHGTSTATIAREAGVPFELGEWDDIAARTPVIADLKPGGRYLVVRNDSSLIAFALGSVAPEETGFRMVGAHTDSPCLMVKPNPEKLRNGCFQLGVQISSHRTLLSLIAQQ